MDVIIELHRPGKSSRCFEERLISDDGYSVHTRSELSFDFQPPWISRPARVVEKHLFYERSFSIMQLQDAGGDLLGHYCDIVGNLTREGGHYHLQDLFLDLWVPAHGNPEELDRDEFLHAFESGLISGPERALAEAALTELKREVEGGRFPDEYINNV